MKYFANHLLNTILILLFVILLNSCNNVGDTQMSITKSLFGKLDNGKEVYLYSLSNSNGMEVKLIEYGAAVYSIVVPDRDGIMKDVVLGFDNLNDFLNKREFYGAIVGRYGNRLGKGKFTLDGVEYQLATNDGENHLHGGIDGFDRKTWGSEIVGEGKNKGVRFLYVSPDGEEGYPGTLKVEVTYFLTENDGLKIDYSLSSDKNTVANVTNHTYFNLSGDPHNDILNQEIQINAGNFTPVLPGLIPNGDVKSVKNTPMDFLTPHKIGARINSDDEQLKLGLGYDHNWVLDGYDGKLNLAVTLYEPESGRVMEVWTTEPAVQFYSGNFLNGTAVGKYNKTYNYRTGLCLETQHYPDSPNHKNFPSTVIKPDKEYKSTTVYRFSAR